MSEHWKGLPLNIGCQESFGVVTESMDEELHMLQSTRTRICQHDAIWSHDVQVTHHHANLCTNMSHIQFESDTLLCNNNLLHIAKYYLLDFTIPFLPITPLPLWGSVGYKHFCGVFTTLHKHKVHYSRVRSILIPSVACQTTEGKYHSTNSFPTY